MNTHSSTYKLSPSGTRRPIPNRLRVLVPTPDTDSRTPREKAKPRAANSASTLRELIASTTRVTQARRRRLHRLLKEGQAMPNATAEKLPSASKARRKLHMDAPLPTSGDAHPDICQSFNHGHAPVPWSAELDKIKAPVLSETEPEDFINFRVRYEDYARKLLDVAERHNTTILPKPVFDCVEKYLCQVSDLLPLKARGDPAEVDPELLHRAIMELLLKNISTRQYVSWLT